MPGSIRAGLLAGVSTAAVSLVIPLVVTPVAGLAAVASVARVGSQAPVSNLTFTAHVLGGLGGATATPRR